MHSSGLPLAALAAGHGFASDPRFAAIAARSQEQAAGDPLSQAWEDGYAAGVAETEAAARSRVESESAAREAIELALARLDGELAEALRQKLYATVEALCEKAIAPLALDREALAVRVARAAEMLARADDDKRLRLHPDDLALVADRLPEGLATEPDPALERGALRLETSAGGIEDGPAHWHRAIAEALAQC